MTFIKEIFLGREKLFTSNAIIFHGALLLMSFAFVYLLSYSTSFGYDLLGGDSSIFQAVGKYWAQGYLPYVDLFDHKGPLLFLINALGYAIYPRSGIMVPQIIFLYLSCLFVWRAMELYSSSRWKVFFMSIALIYYAAHYEEGNHVEEYTVLFLSAATYCFLRSLKEDKFPPLYGFIYGLGFGGCFLIRLSDAAQICCQCFLVAVFLLQARDFKTLWQNVLSFLAGAVIIVLPFVIYFAAHDALYDMIYGTLLFNMKYNSSSLLYGSPTLVERVVYYIFNFLPSFAMIIVALFGLKENPKSRLLQSGLFIGVVMSVLLMDLRTYGHYVMIIFPAMSILFAILHESRDTLQRIWQTQKVSFGKMVIKTLIALTIIDIYMLVLHLKEYNLGEENSMPIVFIQYQKIDALSNPNEREKLLALKQLIPEDEEKSFVCWGDYCTTPHWVIYTDMKPREREFFLNRFHGKVDPAIRKEWFDNVRKDYPLWILYGIDPNRKPDEPPREPTEDAELEQLLAEKYSLKGEVYIPSQIMKLYRLKE